MGNATTQHNTRTGEHGTIRIDVLAATPDGGLIATVTYAGDGQPIPATRVGIDEAGALRFDPAHPPNPQIVILLPLLARGFVAGREIVRGATWTTAIAPPANGKATYAIRSVDGEQAEIGIEADFVVRGVNGYDAHSSGTTMYATDRLCPLAVDVATRTRRESGIGLYEVSDAHLTARLASDSYARH